jgi:cyclic pyranopterin phosphate synthase
MEIKDIVGRSFKTLRVSLLNTCNLACVYCTCGNEDSKENHLKGKDKILSTSGLLNTIKVLHKELALTTVRFTGGEPLLYKQLPELIKGVGELGIKELKLTTNGVLLERLAPGLKYAGLSSINVSLDAIEPEAFFVMSRRHDAERTIRGIKTAKACGIDVKINSVIMRGNNHKQIIPLLQFAFEQNITIRFLEIMSMGHLFGKADQYFFSQEDILEEISKYYRFKPLERAESATANYWQTMEGNKFGIVANESHPFCSDCNRLRLDAYGNIYGCLSSNSPISIKNLTTQAELRNKLKKALAQKQSVKFTGSSLSMLHIGG